MKLSLNFLWHADIFFLLVYLQVTQRYMAAMTSAIHVLVCFCKLSN